eukprot:tig00001154_g7289.t1
MEYKPYAGYNDGKSDVPPHMRERYEREARKNWDIFYMHNKTNFFKDRNWLGREFPELSGAYEETGEFAGVSAIAEVGCGVGNALFPILRANPSIRAYAVDFAPRAVEFVKQHPEYDEARVMAGVCDITSEPLTATMPRESIDRVLLCFVLSAIAPEKMPAAIANVRAVLRDGGVVLFRDYADGDLAQERLHAQKGRRLAPGFYVKADGTRCFYFTRERLIELFEAEGFDCATCDYHRRTIVNRARDLHMNRIWIQARFVRAPKTAAPASAPAPDVADPHAVASAG